MENNFYRFIASFFSHVKIKIYFLQTPLMLSFSINILLLYAIISFHKLNIKNFRLAICYGKCHKENIFTGHNLCWLDWEKFVKCFVTRHAWILDDLGLISCEFMEANLSWNTHNVFLFEFWVHFKAYLKIKIDLNKS